MSGGLQSDCRLLHILLLGTGKACHLAYIPQYSFDLGFSVKKFALTELSLICRCLTILNVGAPLGLCDGESRISNFSGYFMTPSNLAHGTTLSEPTSNALHTRVSLSSYSKLLSKLMPSHLILKVLDGLAAT